MTSEREPVIAEFELRRRIVVAPLPAEGNKAAIGLPGDKLRFLETIGGADVTRLRVTLLRAGGSEAHGSVTVSELFRQPGVDSLLSELHA